MSAVVSLLSAAFGVLYLERRRTTWAAKRDACLEALEIINGIYANREWSQHGQAVQLTRQAALSIADVRRCHNLLVVTCRRPRVVEHYLKCTGSGLENGVVSGDQLDDLRDAIRQECGFRWKKLERNRAYSFLSYVPGTSEAVATPPVGTTP